MQCSTLQNGDKTDTECNHTTKYYDGKFYSARAMSFLVCPTKIAQKNLATPNKVKKLDHKVSIIYTMHGQPTARGPNPARQGFSSSPPINFLGLQAYVIYRYSFILYNVCYERFSPKENVTIWEYLYLRATAHQNEVH